MTQISKLLDDQVVEKAKAQLHKVGKTALMTRKLEAIISAKKHGISKVAEIYDITRKTLIPFLITKYPNMVLCIYFLQPLWIVH